jgi:putative hydrolase of HD superfamily
MGPAKGPFHVPLAIQNPNNYTTAMKQPALSLDRMIQFSQLILQFQDVIRAFYLPRGHKENDVEHSYHLAMMAWYLNSAGELGYNTDRVIKYALLHDLVEAYVGDVHAFDEAGRRGKEERERAAILRFEAEFPEAGEMVPIMSAYMSLADKEASYVYALDKLMPMVMIYLDNGRTWREDGLRLEQIHEVQSSKIALSEPVHLLYQQLKRIFEQRPELFAH